MSRLIPAVSLSCLLVASVAGAQPAPPQKRVTGGPVTLAAQGSFFIGGVTKIADLMLDWTAKHVAKRPRR